MSDSVDMNEVGWLLSSGYRMETCEVLYDDMAMPSVVAEAADMEITHASRSLNQLREHDLVQLEVDEDTRKGRIYSLTDLGERVYERALEVNR